MRVRVSPLRHLLEREFRKTKAEMLENRAAGLRRPGSLTCSPTMKVYRTFIVYPQP